jgi:hypothetical protein
MNNGNEVRSPFHSPEVTTMRTLIIVALTLLGAVSATDRVQAQFPRQQGGATYIYPEGTLGYYVGPQGRSNYYVVPSVSYGFYSYRNNSSSNFGSTPILTYFNNTSSYNDSRMHRTNSHSSWGRHR